MNDEITRGALITRLKRMNQHHKDSHPSIVVGVLPNAVWRNLSRHRKALLFSALFVPIIFLTGCSNDKPPQDEVQNVESAPKPTFEDKQFEVDVFTAFGTYYESLTSYPPRYRCTVRILNKTTHSIKSLDLADCGSPPQSISFGGGQGRVFYSTANITLDPSLQPGERREISFEIKFDDSGGSRVPSKYGPSVKSFTNTNGITFYNTL